MRRFPGWSGIFLSTFLLFAGCSEQQPEPKPESSRQTPAESPATPPPQHDAPPPAEPTPPETASTPSTEPIPSAEPSPPKTTSKPPANLAEAEVSLKIPADEYNYAYLSKEVYNANKGKVLETQGVIRSYEIGHDATPVFRLNKNFMDFACQGSDAVFRAMPGQTVTLRQWIDPKTTFDYWQAFQKWTIVKVEGQQPQTVDAVTIAKDFADDEQAAVEKYHKKYVIISGTVHKLDDDGPRYIVTLTPEDVEPKVVAEYTPYGETVSPKEWVQEGKSVKILAEFSLDIPELSDALALPPEDKPAEQ